MENKENKTQSKWVQSKVGQLWANKDPEGKVKNFSGSITIEGKEYRIFVSKRLKYDNDDPSKNYPALIIYDSAKLDAADGKTAPVANKVVKKKPAPATEETLPEDELM